MTGRASDEAPDVAREAIETAPARESKFIYGPELLALSVFAAAALAIAWRSDGFVTADACTHFLFAKYAFSDPVNLVDVWGRPLCTLIDAGPAQLGLFAVRMAHVAIAVGCALVARAIARGQGLDCPGLAMLFTLGAPLFFLFSFSEMTELPFALVLGSAVLCYQRRQWFLFGLLAGLLPTARPEGFGFVILALIALVIHQRWIALLPLIAPLLAWDVAGWVLTNRPGAWWAWLVHAWPWSEQGLYGKGSLFTYVAVLPVIVPPLVLPATLIGIGKSFSKARQSDAAERWRWWCGLIIAAIPVGVVVGHSVLRWLGKFGSFGEARYLLICAPLWGVVSAAGWEWIFARFSWRHAWRWATLAVVAPAVVNLVTPAVPIRLSTDWQAAQRFAEVYQEESLRKDYPHVIAAHPAVAYFLGIDPNRNGREDAFTSARVKDAPHGAILVWDPVYCATNAMAENAVTPGQILASGWLEVKEWEENVNGDLKLGWKVFKRVPQPQ